MTKSRNNNNNNKKSRFKNIGTISAVIGAIAAMIAAIFGQNGLVGIFNKTSDNDNPPGINNNVSPDINVSPNIETNPDIEINNNSSIKNKTKDNLYSNLWIPPTPKSADEAALYKWLESLRTGNNLQAVELVSNYSLSFYGKTKEDILTEYKLQFNQGKNNVKYSEIAGKKDINAENKLLELVVYLKDEEGKIFSDAQKFVVRKEKNNIWKVNEFRLVDHQDLKKKPTFNKLSGITITPTLITRYVNRLIIHFELSTINQEGMYHYKGNQAICSFQNSDFLGVVNFNNKYIKIDGFKSTYPTKCTFPGMIDSAIYSNRQKAFLYRRLGFHEVNYMPTSNINFEYK